MVPGLGMAMVDGRVSAFRTATTLEETQSLWRKSETTVNTINQQINAIGRLREEALHPKLFYFNPLVYRFPVILAILCWPLFLLIDFLACLSRISRKDSRRVLS